MHATEDGQAQAPARLAFNADGALRAFARDAVNPAEEMM